jgi:DNA-binding transcriptional LysR family regulator
MKDPLQAATPDLDLNLLPVFEALLQCGSVSASADRLGSTQPLVSKQLRRLRDYFGDPLFVRPGQRLRPTDRALSLAPVDTRMMEAARADLVPAAGFDPAASTRVFTLSMSDGAEPLFVPRLLARLRGLAPGVRLRVVHLLPRELPQALEQRQVDLVLGSVQLADAGLFQQQLFRHGLACVSARDHPRLHDGAMDRAGFEACGHIAVQPFGLDEDIFEWALRAQGAQRRFVTSTPSFMVLPMLVEHTDLVATVPQYLADLFSRYGVVTAWPLPWDVPPLAMRQTWHARFHHDAANGWLRRVVEELYREG